MHFYGMTDIGRTREANQDVFYTHKFSDQAGFAIVCDGMGGQSGGHIASDMACSIISSRLIEERVGEMPSDQIRDLVVTAVSEANLDVFKKSNTEPGCKGMGTTAVLAIVSGQTAYIAHVGDSRVYYWSGGRLQQLTRDHSLVQELMEQGKISQTEMKTHPNRNMITRAVGVSLIVDIDYLEMPLHPGEKLLLCSDGLTNMVTDEAIAAVLGDDHAPVVCSRLVAMANEAGGTDNITVAVIE